jgi:hypothetical protein
MNIAQLETDLAAVAARATALITDVTHRCDAHVATTPTAARRPAR